MAESPRVIDGVSIDPGVSVVVVVNDLIECAVRDMREIDSIYDRAPTDVELDAAAEAVAIAHPQLAADALAAVASWPAVGDALLALQRVRPPVARRG